MHCKQNGEARVYLTNCDMHGCIKINVAVTTSFALKVVHEVDEIRLVKLRGRELQKKIKFPKGELDLNRRLYLYNFYSMNVK